MNKWGNEAVAQVVCSFSDATERVCGSGRASRLSTGRTSTLPGNTTAVACYLGLANQKNCGNEVRCSPLSSSVLPLTAAPYLESATAARGRDHNWQLSPVDTNIHLGKAGLTACRTGHCHLLHCTQPSPNTSPGKCLSSFIVISNSWAGDITNCQLAKLPLRQSNVYRLL